MKAEFSIYVPEDCDEEYVYHTILDDIITNWFGTKKECKDNAPEVEPVEYRIYISIEPE